MGMFDYIYINCPNCSYKIEEQTKNGDCSLERYEFTETSSPELFCGTYFCDSCNTQFCIEMEFVPRLIRRIL